MRTNKLNLVLVLGLVAIVGILVVQILWTKEAFNTEGKKFSQKVHVTLLRVVDRLYKYNNNEFPLQNPINKVSNDYYIVNVNNDFDANLLEFCLRTEFERADLITDFEYAIYKCESDEMVYGNYVSFQDKRTKRSNFHFPKQKNLVYYFAIRFPHERGYLLSTLRFWLVTSLILVVILLIYVYSIFTILQQKKYSELQKDFINNMTHEFKTPLSSILIAANYLAKQSSIQEDEKLRIYNGIIIDQSTKLNAHIEKILDVARSDKEPLELKSEPVKVRTLLQHVAESFRLKYPEARISIDAGESDPVIQADLFHLTNVFYNLLDNSVKYCDEQPDIRIRLNQEKEVWCLSVTDNGIGVNTKDLALMFEKFYRGSTKRSREVRGFGLGLYYVRKVIQLHRWKIQALQNPEKGLTISLVIPAT